MTFEHPYRGQPDSRQPKGPAVVLVHPQMGENIGMAARAMLNCGLTDLRLVAPRDGWPNEAALATASGAVALVENARLFNTLADAVADCRFVLGSGSFEREMRKPVFSPETAAHAVVAADKAAGAPVSALVFGAERSGMDNEEVALCDGYITVPLNPGYPSLNLAQAVLLIAYPWYRLTTDELALPTAGGALIDTLGLREQIAATHAETQGLFEHAVTVLDDAGFFKTAQQRPTMVQNLRNTFQRLRLTQQEVNTLRGALKALQKKS